MQGFPGKRVDLCLNGKEVRSNVRYGWKTFLSPALGTYRLKVFKHDRRKCRGTKIAQRSFTLGLDGDLSIVVGPGSPKVLIWDNSVLPPISTAATSPVIAFHHAAKAPLMDFWVDFGVQVGPYVPAIGDHAYARGDWDFIGSADGAQWVIWATRDELTKVLAGPVVVDIQQGRRYEQFLIGTKPRNFRIVTFSRPNYFE